MERREFLATAALAAIATQLPANEAKQEQPLCDEHGELTAEGDQRLWDGLPKAYALSCQVGGSRAVILISPCGEKVLFSGRQGTHIQIGQSIFHDNVGKFFQTADGGHVQAAEKDREPGTLLRGPIRAWAMEEKPQRVWGIIEVKDFPKIKCNAPFYFTKDQACNEWVKSTFGDKKTIVSVYTGTGGILVYTPAATGLVCIPAATGWVVAPSGAKTRLAVNEDGTISPLGSK